MVCTLLDLSTRQHIDFFFHCFSWPGRIICLKNRRGRDRRLMKRSLHGDFTSKNGPMMLF